MKLFCPRQQTSFSLLVGFLCLNPSPFVLLFYYTICEALVYMYMKFGSVAFYKTNLDLLDTDLTKNAIKF